MAAPRHGTNYLVSLAGVCGDAPRSGCFVLAVLAWTERSSPVVSLVLRRRLERRVLAAALERSATLTCTATSEQSELAEAGTRRLRDVCALFRVAKILSGK